MSETDVILERTKLVLDRLIKEVSVGIYPVPLLTEFKHSVDQLRVAMWAVMEAEDQRRKEVEGFAMGLDQKLVEFRMKRLEEMLNQVCSDLTGGLADPSLPDLEPLSLALQSTIRNIGRLTANEL